MTLFPHTPHNPVGCVSPLPSNLLHVLAMLNAKREGTRRTSDMSAAASSLHQIQPDPQIVVRLTERVYAPDRILEWTFPSSIRHRQGPSPTCLLCRKTERKDKDVSGADRLLEPRSPPLFASWAGFLIWSWEDDCDVGFFGMRTTDGKGWCRSRGGRNPRFSVFVSF